MKMKVYIYFRKRKINKQDLEKSVFGESEKPVSSKSLRKNTKNGEQMMLNYHNKLNLCDW